VRKRLPAESCEIVVFNPENHMVFHPLLPGVAGASLGPDVVAAPLRQMLKDLHVRTEQVTRIDLRGEVLTYLGHDGLEHRMPYDHVVVACGQDVNLSMIPGMSDHAFPLKTAGDALALRSHVMQQLEKADACDDPTKRRWYLTFVVVGGGFSGVEVAGEINDLLHESHRFFPRLRPHEMKVRVLHNRDQILPEVSPPLRAYAQERMRREGMDIVLNVTASAATPEGVWTTDGRLFRAATVVCTIGTRPSGLVSRLDAPKEKGRLCTDADLRLQGSRTAWAVGDCASIVNAFDGQRCPPTAQFAEREGRLAGENIVRAIHGKPTLPFRHRPLGQMSAIGGKAAVVEIGGLRMGGLLGWLIWRGTYLMKHPAWSKRIRLAFDWTWQRVFGRDLVHLQPKPSERVTHAHYRPGDYVFRRGDPATSLYIIQSGEVEVLRERDSLGVPEQIAVLRAGDFFGEMALVEERPHFASVRARTPLEVTVVGRNVFTQVSASLAPLRDLVANAIAQRAA
jgi:NADH dehydrogenase